MRQARQQGAWSSSRSRCCSSSSRSSSRRTRSGASISTATTTHYQARLDGAKLERGALEHIVLRLVLADAVRIHFAYTAYTVCAPTCTCTLPLHSSPTSPLLSHLQVLTYLYVRPSLASVLESTPASTADDLHLPPLSRTLDAALLPSPKAAKARPTLTLTTDPSPSPRPNPYLGH